MEIAIGVKWKKTEITVALSKLKRQLQSYQVNKINAIRSIYGSSTQRMQDITSFAIECGIPPGGSTFLFYEGTKEHSDIVGRCQNNQLTKLLGDWEFLEKRMKESKVKFEVKYLQIKVKGVSLLKTKTGLFHYLTSKEALSSLASLAGIVPLITYGIIAITQTKALSIDYSFILAPIIGLILWIGLNYYQYRSVGDFALKE